jgi:tetratricopeptide (TPR) repeat protein
VTVIAESDGDVARMEDEEQEVARLNALIDGDPTNADLYVLRGIAIQYTDRDNSEAMTDFDRAVALDPRCARAYAARAHLHNFYGDCDEAFEDANRALSLDPALYDAYRERAMVYLDREDALQAIADFDRSLKLKPGQPDTLYWRGAAKEMDGDLDGAEQDFAMCQALKPRYAADEDA